MEDLKMQLLDGKTLSTQLLEKLKSNIADLRTNKKPRLDIILIGKDPASVKYVEMKQKKASTIGIEGLVHHLPESISQSDLLSLIDNLNRDPAVSGFMIQLPIPKHLNLSRVLNAIDPAKDADGLTAANLGLLFQNDKSAIAPATPLGIINLLTCNVIPIEGKNVVIIGRSHSVGMPTLALFNNHNATCTLCHKFTQNLKDITSQADILVSAVGKINFVTDDMVRQGAVVVDVGTNFTSDGKLVGDVDFANVAPKCSFITPVPGGVGPMTIASLLENTYQIFLKNL